MGGMRWVLGIPALEESEYNFLAWQSPLFLLCAGRFHDMEIMGAAIRNKAFRPVPVKGPPDWSPVGALFCIVSLSKV